MKIVVSVSNVVFKMVTSVANTVAQSTTPNPLIIKQLIEILESQLILGC